MPLVVGPLRHPAARATAVLAVATLLLAGCVAPKQQTTIDDAPQAPDLDGASIDAIYAQKIVWSPCDESYECAWLAAPLDWDDPTSEAIEIAVKRARATGTPDQRIGSLLINPGGPGGSGLDRLEHIATEVAGDEVRAAYDVVAFDPRGVGESNPVRCGDDAQVYEYFTSDVPMENQADVDAAREKVRVFGEACLESTGPLLGEVDTVSAARDMDLIRAVLGDSQLHYLGYSYGTFLGATYADLYPQNVGRLVLDGAMDPSMSNDDLLIGQAVGFENALRAYVADCQAGDSCPLTGDVDDGMAQLLQILDRIEADPIDAGDGYEVNGTLAFYGIVVTLYDDVSWPYLTMALEEVVYEGTGSILLELANFYLDWNSDDGRFQTNQMEAFSAVNCLDYPMVERDYDEMVAFAQEVAAVAPTVGEDFGMSVGCETWPFPATGERRPIAASGAAPILVVGTTGDPATPYEWSVALAEQLESGSLLTWEGEGHTAYGRAGDCVDGVVEAYLLRGETPRAGATC